jgi:hypothetical protein
MELFYPDEELEKAPLVERKKKVVDKSGTISVSIGEKYIYVKALAKNGYYLGFEIEEIRLLNGKNTAVLKPKGYRKYPWCQLRRYRDIVIQNAVIPERYREEVLALLNTEEGVKIERTSRRRTSNTTPQVAYRLPILESLAEMGGKGRARDVLNRVYERMKDVLTKDDKDYNSVGVIKWENNAHWERLKLVEEGYLKRDSPRGIWELTEEGWEYLRNIKSQRKLI